MLIGGRARRPSLPPAGGIYSRKGQEVDHAEGARGATPCGQTPGDVPEQVSLGERDWSGVRGNRPDWAHYTPILRLNGVAIGRSLRN